MFSNQRPTTSGSELKRPRKRAHESLTNPREKRQQEKLRYKTSEASDLLALLHELTSSNEKTERIHVKDTIGQEFIDRIGKLYKPILIEQNSSKSLTIADASKNMTSKSFEKRPTSNTANISIGSDINSLFHGEILRHCYEELLVPFSNFEDIVMGLADICFGEAISNNESLSRSLCDYIHVMTNEPDGEYDSDTCSGYFHTQEKKRRKVMSACPSF